MSKKQANFPKSLDFFFTKAYNDVAYTLCCVSKRGITEIFYFKGVMKMTNKTTKRALFSSVMALLLCFTMLLGTTFAWFTDSVTSSNNIIKSGTLDVEMYWADGVEDPATASWVDASSGAIFDYDQWEPGFVQVRHIKIENKGTLALKYQVSIVATGEASDLTDVIDVYYVDPAVQVADRAALDASYKIGTLTEVLAGLTTTAGGELKFEENDTITIALKMQESANNNYQDKSIGSSFAIKLMATQLTYESDSFDELYDAMATVDTPDELTAALAGNYDLITLGADIELPAGLVIPADRTVAIDLCGYKLHQKYLQTTAYAMITNNGNLTVLDSIGSGKISYEDIGNGGEYASNTICNKGVLTVNGGTIENVSSDAVMNTGYPHAIDVYPGSVTTINGGTVKSANYDSIRMFCNSTTLATTVAINGGTIFNRVSFQNPHSSNPGYGVLNITGGNFVTTDGVSANVRLLNFSSDFSNMKATVTGGSFDKGFKTQDYANSGVQTKDWLVYEGGIPVTSAADLQNALTNAVDGDVIKFAADITGNVAAVQKTGVSITVDGNGKKFTGVFTVDGDGNQAGAEALTIKNVAFVAANGADSCIYSPDRNSRVPAKYSYAHNVTVDNCTFTDLDGVVDCAAIRHGDGGDKNWTITNCTVDNTIHSLIQTNNVAGKLTISGCTVNSKNGLNLNSCTNVDIIDCDINVLGYAVRYGVNSGGNINETKTFLIKDSTLKSANDDNDAVIIFRADAVRATLTLENTTLVGSPEMKGNTAETNIVR